MGVAWEYGLEEARGLMKGIRLAWALLLSASQLGVGKAKRLAFGSASEGAPNKPPGKEPG